MSEVVLERYLSGFKAAWGITWRFLIMLVRVKSNLDKSVRFASERLMVDIILDFGVRFVKSTSVGQMSKDDDALKCGILNHCSKM